MGVDEQKNIYFSTLRDNPPSLNRIVGYQAETAVEELFFDYRKVTSVDLIVNILLDHRGNWMRIDDPYNYKYINFSFVGSDIALASNKFFKFDVVDGDKIEPLEIELKKLFSKDDVNVEYIDKYEDALRTVKNLKLSKESLEKYKNSAILNRLVLEKSQVGNRLMKITRWIGDKSVLYSMINSYSGKSSKNIPKTFEIDIYKIETRIKNSVGESPEASRDASQLINKMIQEEINSLLEIQLESALDTDIWVVKATHGSRGQGMKFWNTVQLKQLFYSHTVSSFNKFGYYIWMISKFVKSFLWKLENNQPESLKLSTPQIGKPKLWNVCHVIKKFADDGPEDKLKHPYISPETNEVYKYIKMNNPTEILNPANELQKAQSDKYKKFREHKFNDTKGRINKGRIWFVMDLSEGKYKIHIYHKLLFEICVKEFSGNYNDPMEVWTDANEYFYGTGYNERNKNESNKNYTGDYKLDKVNAIRANELDLYYTVDWNDGTWFQTYENETKKQFPLDWKTVKQNFIKFFQVFIGATKDSVHCLSVGNESLKNNVKKLGCFQYTAMDFIIDDSAGVWVLEMNTRPWIGYGNWWNKFDPNNRHVLHKWVFLESLIRKFVDTKFEGNPKLPYKSHGNKRDIPENSWVLEPELTDEYVALEQPIAISNLIVPSKGMANWVMTRQIRNALRGRGWGVFSYSHLINNPKLIMQGMTPLINYLLGTYAGKPEELQYRLMKDYPDLLRANIINRIFPLVIYLGNKGRMMMSIANAFPSDKDIDYSKDTQDPDIINYKKWYDIIPYTFIVKRFNPDSTPRSKNEINENIKKEIARYPNSKDLEWIVKPSLGKQGTGIAISKDTNVLTDTIIHSKDNPDEKDWVVSLYLNNPLLVYNRKTHIRVFVLVHRKKNNVNVYLMEPHLLFLAGLPYEPEKAMSFYDNYFSDDGKVLIPKNSNIYNRLGKYKNLTNLSKGTELFTTYLGKKEPWKRIQEANVNFPQNVTKIEERLGNKNTWVKSDGKKNTKFGYAVLSGKARDEYPDGPDAYDEKIVPQIRQLVKQTIFSIKDDINCVNEQNNTGFDGCYHYLAFDLMLTTSTNSNPHVWLLEVNVNPGLNAPTHQLKKQGGMTGFMNSIFSYVLDDQPNLEIVKFEDEVVPLKYTADGTHLELIEDDSEDYPENTPSVKIGDNIWMNVNHKKDDFRKYRYSKEVDGDEYDDSGNPRQKFNADKEWKKGDDIPTTQGLNGEYYIPKKYRGQTMEWYRTNSAKLIKKHENVFHELLTLEVNANNKTREAVESALLTRNLFEENLFEETLEDENPEENPEDEELTEMEDTPADELSNELSIQKSRQKSDQTWKRFFSSQEFPFEFPLGFPFGHPDFDYFVGQYPLPPNFIPRFRRWIDANNEITNDTKGPWIPVFPNNTNDEDFVVAFKWYENLYNKLPKLSKKDLNKIKKIKASRTIGTNVGWNCLDLSGDKLDRILNRLKIPGRHSMTNKDQKCALLGVYSYWGYPITMEFPYVSGKFKRYEDHPFYKGLGEKIDSMGFREFPFGL